MPFNIYNNAPTDLFQLAKLGMPPRSIIRNNVAASYVDGATIAGVGPATGVRIYIDGIYVYSNVDVKLDIFINGQTNRLGYTTIGPRIELNANKRHDFIPLHVTVYDGMTCGIVAVGAISNAQISFSISGVRLASDANFNAKRFWMHIGDSNTNSTILNAVTNDNYYHAHFANHARDAGASVCRIMKGEGGATSDNADWYRHTGLLNPDRCDLITYMMGTNDSFGLTQFQQPFENFLVHRSRYFPRAKLIVLGPPYRGDGGGAGQETNLIAIRAYIVSRMPSIANAIYVDLSDVAASGVPHNTTYSPDGVHWIGAAHTLWGTQIYNATQTAGWTL